LQSMQPNEMIKVIIDLKGVDTKAIGREVLSKHPNIEIIENLTEPISKRENPDFEVIGHVPVFIRDGQLSRAERLEIRNEIRAAKREAYAQKEKPLLDYLTAKGYDAEGFSGMPTVFATLPKEEVIALQERDDVAKIWRTDMGGHATQCAGVAASTHPTFRGVAHNATIISANADSPWEDDLSSGMGNSRRCRSFEFEYFGKRK